MVEKRSSVAVSVFGRSLERDARRLRGRRLPGFAQRQRQRADRGRERELLRRRHLDLERDRLGERGLVGALVGDLIDRQHAHVLQHHVGRGEVLVLLARQHDVDAIARQHEAGDALDVVDADGDRLHAVLQQRRQGRALAGAGDLRRQHRLVRLDRREHDAPAVRGQVADLVEGTGRHGSSGQGISRNDVAAELGAEAQRLASNDDRLRRDRLLLRLETPRAHLGLAVEPGLREKHRDQAEQDGEPDHHDGAGAHEP